MNQHVINRQVIELKLASEKNAFRIQQQVQELYRSEVLPVLDEIMNRLASDDEVLHIDRLELNLGTLNFEKLEEDVVRALRSNIEEQVKKQVQEADAKVLPLWNSTGTAQKKPDNWATASSNEAALLSKEQSALELLLYFFETGQLPWWSSDEIEAPGVDELIHHLLDKQPVSLLQLFTRLSKHPLTARRFIQQSDKITLVRILALLPAEAVRQSRKTVTLLKKLLKATAFAKQEQAGTEALVLITVLRIMDSGTNHAEEMYVEEAIRTIAFLADEEPAQVEQMLYRETVFSMLKEEKAAENTSAVIPYFVKWEKQKSALAAVVTGTEEFRLEKLLTISKTEAEKKSQRLQEAFQVLQKKYPQLETHASWLTVLPKLKAKEPEKEILPVKKKTVPLSEALPEIQTQQTESPEEEILLNKTPAAGMTRYGGLALLSPFLPAFFKELKLLNEGQFIGEEERFKAIHLLNFIATGKTKAAEYELLFHKLLCGLKLSAPVPKTMKLSTAEKKETMLFLDDIAEQWTTLRTSSGEVFRNTFMRRNGIIEKKEGAWLLRIERTAVDVLLDTLPWTISIVRAPWMQELLHIEW